MPGIVVGLRGTAALVTDFASEVTANSPRPKLSERLGRIADLLESSGIDLDEVGRIDKIRIGEHQTPVKIKQEDGTDRLEVITSKADSLVIVPSWETGPEWPVIQPGPKVEKRKPVKPRTGRGWRTACVLPDMQVGFFWHDGGLIPTHDEEAIGIALAVIAAVQPDVIVMHGDNADFPEFGKYRLSPVFVQTTQPTINRCTQLAVELRDAAPDAEIVWLAGNHEERLPNYVLDNARAAFGLRRGREPQGWPILSMPHLCHFDDSGITWKPGYPANRYNINDQLRVIHGNKTGPTGTVAAKYLTRGKKSVLFGHVHSAEYAELTDEDGWQMIAASAGCLCRTDGKVPSTNSGHDDDGLPVTVHENWQQGMFVVDYRPDSSAFALDRVSIRHGWSRWRGQEFGKVVK